MYITKNLKKNLLIIQLLQKKSLSETKFSL